MALAAVAEHGVLGPLFNVVGGRPRHADVAPDFVAVADVVLVDDVFEKLLLGGGVAVGLSVLR